MSLVNIVPDARIIEDIVAKIAARIEAIIIPPATGGRLIINAGSACFPFVMACPAPFDNSPRSESKRAIMPSNAVSIPKGATTMAAISEALFAVLPSFAASIG